MAEPKWTELQREAVREFLGAVQPNNPAILISNIEELMPQKWRGAFEKLFVAAAGAKEGTNG